MILSLNILIKEKRKMASNSKKTKSMRGRKTKSNKRNLKANQKRIQRNTEILKELASKEKT